MDLVIEGRFFINGELKDTAVGIEDGKIVTVDQKAHEDGSARTQGHDHQQ